MAEKNRIIIAGAHDAIERVWKNNTARGAIATKIGAEPETLTLDEAKLKEGFGSVVVPVKTTSEDQTTGYVLRIPKVGEVKPPQELLKTVVNSGIETTGFWVAHTQPTGKDLSITELKSNESGLYDDRVAGDALFLFMLLKEFEQGDVYLNTLSSDEKPNLYIYRTAGQATRTMHDQPINLSASEQAKWKAKFAGRMITRDERFNTILQVIGDDKPWMTDEQKIALRRKMGAVARSQFQRNLQLVRTHGDDWEGNWWIPQDKEEVVLFDPACAYGYRGDDVAFGIGKQLIKHLTTDSQNSLDAINAFYEGYGNDEMLEEAKKEMWQGVVFKMVVGAAFDKYNDTANSRLMKFANGLLDRTLANPETAFEVSLAKNIWDKTLQS